MKLGIQEDVFVAELAQDISVPGVRLASVVGRLLCQHLTDSLRLSLGDKLTKLPSSPGELTAKDGCPTLIGLAKNGTKYWYLELRFSTRPEDAIEEVVIEPFGVILEPIDYGWGVKRAYQLKTKKLKTQTNHILRLNTVLIEPRVFQRVLDRMQGQPLEQPYAANPRPGPRSSGFELGLKGFEFVAFDHIIDGSRLFCSCARPVHEKMVASAKEIVSKYVDGSWPQQVIRLLSGTRYADGICHLCVARTSGVEAAAERYGDTLPDFLDAYMDQLMLCDGLDEQTARAEVQQQLGLSRWVNEAEMYRIVKLLFPDHQVFREASPPWLGRQRIDVFLPQIPLALEYQGAQHFEAVGVFGGDEALVRTIERDALKKRLCEENRVELVYVKHSDPLTVASLKNRLRRFL